MAEPLQRHQGVIKAVLSGDTVIIRDQPKGGPPPERTLSFAGLSAPRLGRGPRANETEGENDEPMAFESREFVRKKLIGQAVSYTVEYVVPSGRKFGTVYLGSENISHSLVAKGLATFRDGREDGPEAMALSAVTQQAKDAKLGIYSADASKHVRKVKYTIDDAQRLYAESKGKEIPGVVEHVRNGCTLKVLLLPSMQSVMIALTGIKTPIMKRENGQESPEPFYEEAKYFVESRLLHRDIKVVIEGTATSGDSGGATTMLGTILHPRGNISHLLLNEGFARIVDWSFGQCTQGKDFYRRAENAAKQKKLRVWRNYQPPLANIPAGERTFSATVVEIINPERFVVKMDDGSKKELSMASIRQPRKPQGNSGGDKAAGKQRSRPIYDVPFMFEAREFLRKKLVGKRVNVEVEYIKPAEQSYPEKTCVTVFIGGVNIAVALLSKGLSYALRHRSDDASRSSKYDDLMAAESQAKEAKVGVHSVAQGSDGPIMRISDVNNKERAEHLIASMKRSGKVQGMVDYVMSGSRMRVHIPKERAICTILLAGVSCPRTGFNGKPDEPFSVEAKELVRDTCLQRDVEIEAFDSDKNGGIVANIFIDGQNLAGLLLEQGYGSMHFSASRYGTQGILSVSEAAAKSAKKGIWENYDPAKEAAEGEGASPSRGGPGERKKDLKPVMVTEVVDPISFYAQYEESAEKLAELMKVLNEKLGASAEACKPKRNQICACKFHDGQYYRAKVEKVDGNKFEIRYIDYGNAETVTEDKCAELPEEVTAMNLPAQAVLMRLAFLGEPPSDYAEEATVVLSDGILDKTYSCNEEYTEGDHVHVTLKVPESEDDVAVTMLSMGYATVARRRGREFQEAISEYRTFEKEAKSNRMGMWMYGDISEDPRDI
eukprot:m.7876 g.7876  ORF g.7876 m.7876 type:complete len:888 (+) comp3797_c2_seq1:3386-6049(+)